MFPLLAIATCTAGGAFFMVVEKWLDAGRTDRPIDERTARIIEEFERDGYQSQTTVDSRGHRQMRFSKYVPDRQGVVTGS
jgi:hypothetical protein